MDPELRSVVADALHETNCFADKYDRAVWFALMEPRLTRYVKDAKEREQILHNRDERAEQNPIEKDRADGCRFFLVIFCRNALRP